VTPIERPVRPAGGVAGPEPGRSSRCSLHPGRQAVGTCAGCRRGLCVACAVPVRGVLVGPECLASFVEDAPVVEPADLAVRRTGPDAVAMAGFAVVLAASVLPWARFAHPRLLGAWTWGWALLAPLAAVAALVALPLWRRWPLDPRFETGVLGLLALVAAFGAVAYRLNPPLLAGSSAAPLLAVAGAAIALGAVVWGAMPSRRR
jgi:hypothetical protein